jgi:hypothetical protein
MYVAQTCPKQVFGEIKSVQYGLPDACRYRDMFSISRFLGQLCCVLFFFRLAVKPLRAQSARFSGVLPNIIIMVNMRVFSSMFETIRKGLYLCPGILQ